MLCRLWYKNSYLERPLKRYNTAEYHNVFVPQLRPDKRMIWCLKLRKCSNMGEISYILFA